MYHWSMEAMDLTDHGRCARAYGNVHTSRVPTVGNVFSVCEYGSVTPGEKGSPSVCGHSIVESRADKDA